MKRDLNKLRLPTAASLVEGGSAAQGVPDVERLTAMISRSANASAVFGEPIHQGASIVVPVAKATWGVGGGRGPKDTGKGGGGGLHVAPVGYLHLENGQARFHPIRRLVISFGAMIPFAGSLIFAGQQLRLMRRTKRAKARTLTRRHAYDGSSEPVSDDPTTNRRDVCGEET